MLKMLSQTKRKLGNSDLDVSIMGLGCMGMSNQGTSDTESLKTLYFAIENGINFLDTADLYGWGHNEELIANFLAAQSRDKIVLATKCGFIKLENEKRGINGTPEHIKKSCEASLKRLKTDVIDLYYLHRADRHVPIEDSVGALADLVKSGKVRYIGLSEVTPTTLRKASKVHPISALQSEYSLWHRKPEKEILATCRELGISFVPFSPLGRGFLTGMIRDSKVLDQNDFRRSLPRFQDENIEKNLRIVEIIQDVAKKKNCTAAQLAIAWVLAQGNDIIPIPGTRTIERLRENMGALEVKLTKEDLQELDDRIPMDSVSGEQFPEHLNFEV